MSTALRFDTKAGWASFGPWSAPFSFGRDGAVPVAKGREGDGKTPLGRYRLRSGLYRADRMPRPITSLTLHPMQEDDGWCDAPDHPAYNRFVQRPFAASHEPLWRDDGVYDVVLVISHNDSPPVAGLGSAVFIHCRQPDHRPTLGCLGLSAPDMWALLPKLRHGTEIEVV
ncbi:L,D-transpeptidase family protein [Algimonas ampicilliniresistens]|uniref:L,D-transpeptidase family protein n=1 Tax=Algimonas ampicilliniresistens TaxID=1298735 RepID=UPI0024E085DF|nr:L,D-transpeptidase family protein [Algimonas ampicilliniresistens]